MSPRTIKLLHVEDDVSQRLIIAKYLSAMKDFSFNIAWAAAEITALSEFGRGGVDFVLLDYRLTLGNGLTCLRKLRQIDPAVPIVAMSGVAAPEIVEQLLQAGADDFLNKDDLNQDTLATCVRHVLARAPFRAYLLQACKSFVKAIPADAYRHLDELEAAAQQGEAKEPGEEC